MHQDLIGQQIQELSHKQHVDNITQIRKHQYQLAYSPQLTNSPYSHLTFTLIITLPPNYPEDPPALNFVDKIYHLNVDPANGEVHMPILSDDWSPFLTLAAVLDSLDNLLEQPDKDYAASEVLREEYLNEPERYLQRIQQAIKASSDDFVLLNNSQSVVEHVQIITDSKLNERMLSNSLSEQAESNQINNGKDLSEIPKVKAKQLKKSTTREEAIKIETLSNSPSQYLPQNEDNLVANQTNSEREIQPKLSKQSQVPVEIPTSIQPPLKKSDNRRESSRRTIKSTENIQMASNQEFQKIHLSLRQTDRMIQLLMGENDEMEQTLKRVGTGRLKERLLEKQKRILQMIQQTLELSSSLREKLFERLKADTKSLLR